MCNIFLAVIGKGQLQCIGGYLHCGVWAGLKAPTFSLWIKRLFLQL